MLRFPCMSYYVGSSRRGVLTLVLFNVLVFFLQGARPGIIQNFSLDFGAVVYGFEFWRLFTYMFIHGDSFIYLFFNMLILYWVGGGIEGYWGRKYFLYFYFFSGIFAGICVLLAGALFHFLGVRVMPSFGSSSVVAACFLVYGSLAPDAGVLFFFILPTTMRRLLFFSVMLWAFWLVWQIASGIFEGVVSPLLFSVGNLSAMLGVILFMRVLYKKSYEIAQTKMSIESEVDLFLQTLRLKTSSSFWTTKPSFWQRLFRKKENSFVAYNFDESKMSANQIEFLIDVLLEKISKKGIKGLKKDERDFLERVSKDFKHKFPD